MSNILNQKLNEDLDFALKQRQYYLVGNGRYSEEATKMVEYWQGKSDGLLRAIDAIKQFEEKGSVM